MNVGVIGLGHVGLPTALGFAESGWNVAGADRDSSKVAQIARGEAPFFEAGVQETLRRHLDSGRFEVTGSISGVIESSDVLFVCVGTPQRDDGSADLSQLEGVAVTIAQHLNGYKLVVEKSTTPVRTAERLKRTISRYANGNTSFEVAVNPEFLQEGTALLDFLNPDRVVLGVETERGKDLLLELYHPLIARCAPNDPSAEDRLIITDLNTAELIKHASNAFLATKISFINMIGDLCEATGADVKEVAKGLGLDPRIGPKFLNAGVGFGGYCLPKDLRAFIRIGQTNGVDVRLLEAVEDINSQRIERLMHKVHEALWVLRGKTVAIWGLAFKPNTDDVREAPSLKVVARLLDEGAHLRLHDPSALPTFREVFPEEAGRLEYCPSPYDAAAGADAIVLLTEWDDYRSVELSQVFDVMKAPLIIDGRNALAPEAVRALGFEYHSMGRR